MRLEKGRGDVTGAIAIGDVSGKLSFRAPVDQSYLPDAVAGLESLLEQFPHRLGSGWPAWLASRRPTGRKDGQE